LDERELDLLALEAGRSYDFRSAALVRDLRGHRSMLRRYVTAHLNATQARTDQLPAATHALLEAYNDAWELLGNRIAPQPCETLVPRTADRRVGERRSTIERRCGERRCPERAHVGRRVLFATDRRMAGRRMGEPRAVGGQKSDPGLQIDFCPPTTDARGRAQR
jgi:hypothetical protein